MKPIEAERYLASILRPLIGVHSSMALLSQALLAYQGGKFSWYDALILSSAMQASCELLYSEDMQHGQKIGSLCIVNPFL